MEKQTVTVDNIDSIRETMAAIDQADELIPGCETWGILHGGNRGQMTIWPNTRGAVSYGGNSIWGDWDKGTETLTIDDGGRVSMDGRSVTE